jgi:hypothetical protein
MATHTDGLCDPREQVVLNGGAVNPLHLHPQETRQESSSSSPSSSFPLTSILHSTPEDGAALQFQPSSPDRVKDVVFDCVEQSKAPSNPSTESAESELPAKDDSLDTLIAEKSALSPELPSYHPEILRKLIKSIVAENPSISQFFSDLEVASEQSIPYGIIHVDNFVGQQLHDSFLSTVSARIANDGSSNLELLGAPRALYALDAELSDSDESTNEYRLMARGRDPEKDVDWLAEELRSLADTGSPDNFIFPKGLAKIGTYKLRPIPPRKDGKVKGYTSPINSEETIVPQYFVRLILWNPKVGLHDVVDLKIFDIPAGTKGFDIILGRKFIRKHNDPFFLPKVAEAIAHDPRLSGDTDNTLSVLLKGKTSKSKRTHIQRQETNHANRFDAEQKSISKQKDDIKRTQDHATHIELYKKFSEPSSGASFSSQWTGSAVWSDASGPSQGHSAGFSHASVQQPNAVPSEPYLGGISEWKPAQNHNAASSDFAGEWRSQRTYTSSTQFTQSTKMSNFSFSRQSTASSRSSCTSIPADRGKHAGYTTDDAIPQGKPNTKE